MKTDNANVPGRSVRSVSLFPVRASRRAGALFVMLALALPSTQPSCVVPATKARELTDLPIEELMDIKVTAVARKETTL